VPDYTTLRLFLRPLDGVVIEPALTTAIYQLSASLEERGTVVTVDATSLASGAISTFFIKRAKNRRRLHSAELAQMDGCRRYRRPPYRDASGTQGLYNNYATLCPPLDAANRRVPVGARAGRRGS
jgi:hypothetical protein